MRLNNVSGRWVIIAPARGKRPGEDPTSGDAAETTVPESDPLCPFCPGNEHMLPGITLELPGDGKSPWRTRIVPNKYPALTPAQNTSRQSNGIYVSMPNHGHHEVIVESPLHDEDIPDMSPENVGLIVETYHKRYLEFMQDDTLALAVIFRNHGRRAGASLAHPHSQFMATGVVPSAVRHKEEEAQRYYDDTGKCVLCEMLASEAKDGQRVVVEDEAFVGFVPFAAEVPLEIWIVPTRHQSDFGTISDAEKAGLSLALRNVLKKLSRAADDPDYNYIIHSSSRDAAGAPYFHWYLQIRPRLTTPAGFEVATGMMVNPSVPEEDAELLNRTADR